MDLELSARIRQAWPAILAAVSEGKPENTLAALAVVYADCSVSQLRQWVRLTPNARAELDSAQEDGADNMVERLPEIINGAVDHRRARVLCDYLWKTVASRNPARYSERRQIDLRAVPLDMGAVLAEAQRRLEARQAGMLTIEGHSERVIPAAAALAAIL